MHSNILSELELAPSDAPRLSPRLRDRLVYFLLRWKYHAALDACLSKLLAVRPLLSLLDARAQMLLDEGLLDAAWQTMCERHQRSASMSSRILAARIRLAQHDLDGALAVAKALADESPESSLAWDFLGEVRLAAGDDKAALAAYRRANDLVPDSRAYLLGVVAVYQARGDWVTASAYAVRLQGTATPESPLPVTYLRRLREYFKASREPNRVADIDAELTTRHAAELTTLREALVPELGHRPSQREERQVEPELASAVQSVPSHPEPLDSFKNVPVSPQEREKLRNAARRIFGYEDLLPGQAEIMSCTMRDEDVLAVLPTGGGKSLCYQLPALLASSGTTLVISPLVALMKDQVDKLPPEANEFATTLNSSLEGDELDRRLRGVRAGRYRLVYAAPERLRQPPFLHGVRRAGVNRLVVDEVHCVSMWGHDFRPDYLRIAEARQALGNPPLLAMTATAAPRVRLDILQRLGAMRIIAGDVMRSNLRLEAFHARDADDKLRCLLSFCRSEPGAGIIYAGTRRRCEELAEVLRSQGVSAIHYHAGIENRAEVQDEFMSGHTRVVVATVAFGMGIDKPDIRFIVHYEPPPSLEAYYQEAGRAGRDGLLAHCLLMYAPSDRATLTRRARRDELTADFLRQLYAAVKRDLDGASIGRVIVDDLRRDLQAEETQVRVGISMLEQMGMLRSWQDVPRTMTLRLTRTIPEGDPGLAALCDTARLQVGRLVTRDPLEMAQQAGLDQRDFEQRILTWTDGGCLECLPSARDPLLEVLPAPQDAHERASTLLEQYEKVRGQRSAEIVAYATTRRCRHGHISAYLGGRATEKCASCDNCVPLAQRPPEGALPEEGEQLRTILGCLAASRGWGRHNLALILRGSREAPEAALGHVGFGALAFRSEAAIDRMLGQLIKAGLLQTRQLEHGGLLIGLTSAGHRALEDVTALRALAARPAVRVAQQQVAASPPRRKTIAATPDVSSVSDDDELLKRLRAWRLEKARAAGLPPFMIAHLSLLRSIAAAHPHTESELLAIKGMGPRKFEKYGPELLALVREEAKKNLR